MFREVTLISIPDYTYHVVHMDTTYSGVHATAHTGLHAFSSTTFSWPAPAA